MNRTRRLPLLLLTLTLAACSDDGSHRSPTSPLATSPARSHIGYSVESKLVSVTGPAGNCIVEDSQASIGSGESRFMAVTIDHQQAGVTVCFAGFSGDCQFSGTLQGLEFFAKGREWNDSWPCGGYGDGWWYSDEPVDDTVWVEFEASIELTGSFADDLGSFTAIERTIYRVGSDEIVVSSEWTAKKSQQP